MIILNESSELISQTKTSSRMPLETIAHWNWHNPLNILPALMLFALAIALLGYLMQLV